MAMKSHPVKERAFEELSREQSILASLRNA